uniref:EGF domain-specific O-linked N-acetylglucosamine transferase n=1 Tax=Ditylum brightwellii TaxID=49249 RepID=A0A7S4QML8_9STRA|mmetsp:Transcript_13452/g.18039  ORF Transcript_13452/g.18039 Transcript_13452/m.18039 type:complete len:572 (-) Transcript_13452:123-1838(-)
MEESRKENEERDPLTTSSDGKKRGLNQRRPGGGGVLIGINKDSKIDTEESSGNDEERARRRHPRHGVILTLRSISPIRMLLLVIISAGASVWVATMVQLDLELDLSPKIKEPEPLQGTHKMIRTDRSEQDRTDPKSATESKQSLNICPPSEWEKNPGSCPDFDHSIKRPQHGCQVNEDTKTVFCTFDNLRIDTQKIRMKPKGGEVLSTVMGQAEESEYPKYQQGAFSVPTAPTHKFPNEYLNNKGMHYLADVLNAMQYPTTNDDKGQLDFSCQQTYPGTTLFLTRYEYVNVFHTMTDWWNAFFVLPRKKAYISENNNQNTTLVDGMECIEKVNRVVFLDGHPQGSLDPTWESLFAKYHFIQHMGVGGSNSSSGLCFEQAIFVPPGYKSPLFDNDPSRRRCPHKGMTKAFSDFVLEQHNLLHNKGKVIKGNIVLIDRHPFISHPRIKLENFERKFKASDLEKLQKRLASIPGATLQVVRLEKLSFREQLALMQESHIVIGMHGAALTHLLFMDENRSQLIELMPRNRVDFFQSLSEWKGMNYKRFTLDSSGQMNEKFIDDVVRHVEKYIWEN